jgi:4-hydroxy-4-methyl-2-oxoglutarate aldolase
LLRRRESGSIARFTFILSARCFHGSYPFVLRNAVPGWFANGIEKEIMTTNIDSNKKWFEYLKTVDTPTLSNAIEVLKVRPRNEGFTPVHVRCLFPELGRMVGYAVTAQVETMTPSAPDRACFIPLYEAVEHSPKPAIVVFQEVGYQQDHAAHCGEVMATIFQRLGAVGLVSDCAVRDIPEVRAMGFQCFARGAVASHAYFRIVRVGVPIQVQGMTVRPNDVLHGDENGLIVVPEWEHMEKLPEAVDAVRGRESKLMNYVRGPQFTFAGLRDHVLE